MKVVQLEYINGRLSGGHLSGIHSHSHWYSYCNSNSNCKY